MTGSFENPNYHNQNAVQGLNANGDVSIGDIDQSINQSQHWHISNVQDNQLESISSEYNKRLKKIQDNYDNDKLMCNLNLTKELEEYKEEIEQKVNDNERKKARLDSFSPEYPIIIREISELKKDSQCLAKMTDPKKRIIETSILYFLGQSDQSKEFWELSIKQLSLSTREKIRNLKSHYDKKFDELEKEYLSKVERAELEKNSEVYSYLFSKKLEENGYPLKTEDYEKGRVFYQRSLNLNDKLIEKLEHEVIRPYFEISLEKYKKG